MYFENSTRKGYPNGTEHVTRCSILLVLRETKIKTNFTYTWHIKVKATNEQTREAKLIDTDYRIVVTRGFPSEGK